MLKRIVSVVVLVGVVGVGAWFLLHSISPQPIPSLPSFIPTPTPLPFAEMTIPYLRERSYTSALGPLTPYGPAHSTYASYLTNYTSDGLRINGLLTKPLGPMPAEGWPAIVFVHGYIPPSLYKTTERYDAYIHALAQSGFVVFKIDLRGHDTSEGEATGAYNSSDYVIDTLNAYAALAHADFVNPEAIGLWGHSMAGNVTMRAMAAKPTIPALVIWAGAVYTYLDQREFGINDTSYRPPTTISQQARQTNRRREMVEKVGTPSATSIFWQQVAPTNYLTDLKGAIQINHAIDDTVVNIGYSRGLMKLLDATQVPHELYEYHSGGHNIEGINFNIAMQHTIDFFKKYLQ